MSLGEAVRRPGVSRADSGRIVGGKYCLLYELGRGGMGSVWAAEHIALRSKVAVKLIERTLHHKEEAFLRFAREARAAAAFRSPHVVQVLDYGIEEGRAYLVMELLEGETLSDRIDRLGKLSPRETWRVLNHLGRAMGRAHSAGFVHRDLKPENLFLVDDDEEFLLKVLDFGVAKALAEVAGEEGVPVTRAGTFVGTPHYVSAEQAQGYPVDGRADVWSMGVLAFECLTGSLPFDAPALPGLLRQICIEPIPVPSSVARVPAGFDAWFAQAVSRDIARRFQTAKELVEALRPILAASGPSDWVGPPETSSSVTPSSPTAGTLCFETFPSWDLERRGEVRFPSSIPTGINGRRDFRHVALIYNVSRTGALMVTRQACELHQELGLTLHLESADAGEELRAVVVRSCLWNRADNPLWKFEVGVRFLEPISDALLARIERRAIQGGSSPPSSRR